MGSPLDYISTEGFRKKLMTRNLVPYAKSPTPATPPITYEVIQQDLTPVDSPDFLIDTTFFADKQYTLNRWGNEGGYEFAPDITGNLNDGNTNAFTATVTNNPSAFYFDESLDNGFYNSNTSTNSGWVAYTGIAPTNIGVGQGLRVLIRGSKGQTNSLTGGAYTPDAVTISVNGQLKQGDFIQNLQYSNANTNKGWNLISNPYASNIDWLLVGRNNVDNLIDANKQVKTVLKS